MTRRQFSSCDPCRQSKRRCEPLPQGAALGAQSNRCSNCVRLRLNCTYNFASSKKRAPASRRSGNSARSGPTNQRQSTISNPPTAHIVIGDEFFAGIENPSFPIFDDLMEPFSDPFGMPSLEEWAPTTLLEENDVLPQNSPLEHPAQRTDLVNAYPCRSPGLLVTDVEVPALRSPQVHWSLSSADLSPSSPLRILNRSFESKLLSDKMFRVYKHVGFLSVSSFLGNGCNPFTEEDFDLEKGETASWSSISNDPLSPHSSPASSNSTPSIPSERLSVTMIGAATFLDHFGTLYGNRLDKVDNVLAQNAFDDVFHAFSIQWIHQYDERAACYSDFTANSPDPAVGWWCKARSSLQKAQKVPSFKTIWAMLLFNMTTVPPQFVGSVGNSESHQKNDFLGDCISHLAKLRQMVIPYCENLGRDSTYANALKICLSLFTWLALLRDSTTSMLNLQSPVLESITFEPEKGDFVHSSAFPFPTFLASDDKVVFGACRSALTEMIFLWRRIHPYLLRSKRGQRNGNFEATTTGCNDPIKALDTVASALDAYELKYRELMRQCLINHTELSARTKFFSGIWIVFWNHWLLRYADGLENLVINNNITSTIFTSKIYQFRWTAVQSIAAISIKGLVGQELPPSEVLTVASPEQAVPSAEALAPDDVWDDDHSVPLIASHATSSIIVSAIEKATESLIEMRQNAGLHGPFMGLGINGNPLLEWSRTLSTLVECLVTLQKVACTARLATVCLQGLMQKNGDLISEHWVGVC